MTKHKLEYIRAEYYDFEWLPVRDKAGNTIRFNTILNAKKALQRVAPDKDWRTTIQWRSPEE